MPYGIRSFCPMIASSLAITNNVSVMLHHAMLSLHGSFHGKGTPPIKLKQTPFKPPKFPPWDHVVGDQWLADDAARHLSQMSGIGFQHALPNHARQAQAYLGQGAASLHMSEQHSSQQPNDSLSRLPGGVVVPGCINQKTTADYKMNFVATMGNV